MKTYFVLVYFLFFAHGKASYGQDSSKIEKYLKGYHQIYDASDIETLKSDVFGYFELDVGSELKKEMFKSTREYKIYLDSLNKIKSSIKGLSYIVFPGYQSWNDENEYDLKNGGFYFFTGNRAEITEKFDVRNKVDLEFFEDGDAKIVFTNLNTVLKYTKFYSGESESNESNFKDEHLFIPVPKSIGLIVEESSDFPKVHILFNCTGYRTYKEYSNFTGTTLVWNNDYLVGTVKRIFITCEDKIVYEKIYQ